MGVDQPSFGCHAFALGAETVFAGVVPDAIEVVIFTVLCVSAQYGGAIY